METNKYKLFHAKRIFDVLMDCQTPMNDHDNGVSDCGLMTFRTKKEKLNRILSSLFEIGLITSEEQDNWSK